MITGLAKRFSVLIERLNAPAIWFGKAVMAQGARAFILFIAGSIGLFVLFLTVLTNHLGPLCQVLDGSPGHRRTYRSPAAGVQTPLKKHSPETGDFFVIEATDLSQKVYKSRRDIPVKPAVFSSKSQSG